MTKDNIVFATFGFLLGLVIGGMLIGPKLAQSKLAGAQPAAAEAPVAAAATTGTGGNPMGAVFERINTLKAEVERNPNNAEALTQLGTMYMDAGKFPQAIEYFERTLSVRDDAQVRTDLGICYRNNGDSEKSLVQFRRVVQTHPEQWQALFNEVIILGETRRFDEARVELAKLQKLRPGDADVAKLAEGLANAK